MDWKGRRQSTNVVVATTKDKALGDQAYKGMTSSKLRQPTTIDNDTIPSNYRTGQLETGIDTGQDDHDFFEHFQKDNLSNG